jgi:hypothetical protein
MTLRCNTFAWKDRVLSDSVTNLDSETVLEAEVGSNLNS